MKLDRKARSTRNVPRPWTRAEDATLAALYPDTGNKEIAERLGRTKTQVMWRARVLGLWKSEGFIMARNSSGGRASHQGLAGRRRATDMCTGLFCGRKFECQRYEDWQDERTRREVDERKTLNDGRTVLCIGDGLLYHNFKKITDD